MKTYKAMEITTPGQLNIVERPIRDPGPGQVRLRVEAAGVCHTDILAVEGVWPGLQYPLVPGHEIAGRIDALGEGVTTWKVGQRVGVGWFGGECGECEPCRRGDFINCINLIIPGFTRDGGYAELVIVEARSLASIPEELSAEEAAPLLCAGCEMPNYVLVLWWLYKVLVVLVIWAFNLHDEWDFIRLRLLAAKKKKN